MDWHKFWFRQSWFLDEESQWLLCVTLSAMSRLTFLGQSKMSSDGLTWNLVQTLRHSFCCDPLTFHLGPSSGQNFSLSNTLIYSSDQLPAEPMTFQPSLAMFVLSDNQQMLGCWLGLAGGQLMQSGQSHINRSPFYTACSRQECCAVMFCIKGMAKEWGGIVFLYLKRQWRYEQSGIDVCVKRFSQQCVRPTIIWYVKSSQQQLASNSKNKNRNLKCHCKLRDNKVQELLTL